MIRLMVAVAIATLFSCTLVEAHPEGEGLKNFCRTDDCYITARVPTTVPTNVSTTTQHLYFPLLTTFSYFTNVSYEAHKSLLPSFNAIELAIVLFNIPDDPCGDEGCWMRIRFESDYPFIDPDLEGDYDYENKTLSLYPAFYYGFPHHNVPTNYTVSFETCVINPLFPDNNHCSEDSDPKFGLLQRFRRQHRR